MGARGLEFGRSRNCSGLYHTTRRMYNTRRWLPCDASVLHYTNTVTVTFIYYCLRWVTHLLVPLFQSCFNCITLMANLHEWVAISSIATETESDAASHGNNFLKKNLNTRLSMYMILLRILIFEHEGRVRKRREWSDHGAPRPYEVFFVHLVLRRYHIISGKRTN